MTVVATAAHRNPINSNSLRTQLHLCAMAAQRWSSKSTVPEWCLSLPPIPTGRHQWHRIERTLTEDSQIDLLETQLRALNPDLSQLVVDLRVEGVVSLSGRQAFEERILQSVGAAFRGLRFDDAGLALNP